MAEGGLSSVHSKTVNPCVGFWGCVTTAPCCANLRAYSKMSIVSATAIPTRLYCRLPGHSGLFDDPGAPAATVTRQWSGGESIRSAHSAATNTHRRQLLRWTAGRYR